MAVRDYLTGEDASKRTIDGRFRLQLPAMGATQTDFFIVGSCPFDGVIESVIFIPKQKAGGVAGQNRKQQVINRKADNSGSSVMASKTYNQGSPAPAKTPLYLTLSGVAENKKVKTGDVLEFASAPIGTGLPEVGGFVEIFIVREYMASPSIYNQDEIEAEDWTPYDTEQAAPEG